MPRAPKFIAAAARSLAPSPHNLFAGTSGWAYPTWKPGFYPADVPTRAFLHHYAARLTSVEVNYTFRELPTEPQLNDWLAATPPGFRFSFKAPQQITHFKRLLDVHGFIAEFVTAIKPARAGGKLGALLFQLPPNFKPNLERLADALAAPALHGHRVAFEFRHEGWFNEETYALLRQHNAALCIAESDDLVTPDITTADFAYYRLRRNEGYTAAKLRTYADRFTTLARTAETFVYFKHEDEPTGALNATAMLRRAELLAKKPAAAEGRSANAIAR